MKSTWCSTSAWRIATKLGFGILLTNVENAIYRCLQHLKPFSRRERKHPTDHREIDTLLAVAGSVGPGAASMRPACRASTISLDTISPRGIIQIVKHLPLTPQVFHILVALADRDQHGYAIMQDVAERTGGEMRLSPGTLYGSIKRMLEQGLVVELRQKDRPDAPNDDERRRYYRLTPFGRKVAKAEAARLSDMVEQARVYGLAPKRG